MFGVAEKFTFFESFYGAFSDFPDEDRLELYDALMRYVFKGEEPSLDGSQATVWQLVKPNVDKSVKRSQVNTDNATKSDRKSDRKSESKATAEAKPSKDKDRDKEEDKEGKRNLPTEEDSSSRHASDGAAAAKAAPASARCPRDGAKLWRNTQTGRWHCPECMESFDPGGVL